MVVFRGILPCGQNDDFRRQQEALTGFWYKEFAMIQVTFAFLVILFLIAVIIGLIVGVALARPTIR